MEQEETYLDEIRKLQEQIEEINSMVKFCSSEIIMIVNDLQAGKEITAERIKRLQEKWSMV